MGSPSYVARRATVDDLEALKKLWGAMDFDVRELEPRLTEFQVALSATGEIVGATALRLAGQHGWIHSESFSDFGLAEEARPVIWERILRLCRNHGVTRLWTREQALFWGRNGMKTASTQALEKLPMEWDRSASGWLTFPLRDEETAASIEREFAMFVAFEKQRTAQAIEKARRLKTVCTVIGFLVTLGVLAAAAWLMFLRRKMG